MNLWKTIFESMETIIRLQPDKYKENVENLEKILKGLGLKKYVDTVDHLIKLAKEEHEKSKENSGNSEPKAIEYLNEKISIKAPQEMKNENPGKILIEIKTKE